MIQFHTEQRMNRSDIAQEAIELQLAAVAERAQFSSLVLADELGLIMARVGDSNFTEEMAAISPALSKKSRSWRGKVLTSSGRIMQLTIAAVSSKYGSLFLCAAGGMSSSALHELYLGGCGVDRILA